MALQDLKFDELFRIARIRELKESIITNNPQINFFAGIFDKIEQGNITQEDFDKCIANNKPEIIMYLKFDDPLFNEANLIKAVSIKGYLLGYIPNAKQTKNICLAACKNDGAGALGFVDNDIIDNDIVLAAIKQNPNAKSVLTSIYNNYVKSIQENAK